MSEKDFSVPSAALINQDNILEFLSVRLDTLSLEIRTLKTMVDYARAKKSLEKAVEE